MCNFIVTFLRYFRFFYLQISNNFSQHLFIYRLFILVYVGKSLELLTLMSLTFILVCILDLNLFEKIDFLKN